MSGWLETYRGTVSRWEVDHNDHLTVAYYFARIADAGLGVLEASGLGAEYAARGRRACVTADCYVRYSRELRVGDILHIESGVIDVEAADLVLGHKLFNTETGEVCTTVEQRVGHVELAGLRVEELVTEHEAGGLDADDTALDVHDVADAQLA